MTTQDALLTLFCSYQVQPTENTNFLADQFGLVCTDGVGSWEKKKKPARVISTMGIEAQKALKNFLQQYKKYYRHDRVAIAFYALTDEEIADLFLELPYYLKSYFENTTYMPAAENFLKEKLWYSNYPNKIAGERKRVIGTVATTWDEYLETVPESMRESVEIYKDAGVDFNAFKAKIND